MKQEHEPISGDEWLLRRVHRQYFRPGQFMVISPNAFEPRVRGRAPDTDGISLFRAACLSRPEEVLSPITPNKRKDYGVVRISVRFIKSLGLNVVSRPVPDLPGHVVIPELNAYDYAANKSRFTPIKMRLAEEASQRGNTLIWPEGVSP
ncbi:MAG: hypothetical protein RMI91_11630 [Gemmatales bacterium]|nr:hypothetical protein [Gemmatales bacterium]MDW7995292.1 hypothetical protein [Gemmatales bacterium]